MNWLELTPSQRGKTLTNMQMYGDKFAQALAIACFSADPINERKLMSAFPVIVSQFLNFKVPA